MKVKLKRLGKILLRSMGALLFAILLYFIIAVVLSFVGTRPDLIDCDQKKKIFLTSNGIHLDFVFPRSFLKEAVLTDLSIPKGVKYVAFGWGDRGFYLETPTWEDLKWSTAINAIFLKSESVMHVTHYRRPSSSWKTLALCDQQVQSLLDFAWTSFKRNESDALLQIGTFGYTKYDFFYEANGSYSLFKTCNNWVNVGLKKAQVKTAVWSPFDWGILRHLEQESKTK